ncbi:hypothetical protein Fmac_025114 [Flemingia macrophylla]|uniref:Protein kinase domain-containing protein n=1 Tax=Flemingia macrophylla TaxID=520843 RepID=A0ABD1LR98_9FABA
MTVVVVLLMRRKRRRERCLLYQVDELGPASVKFNLDKATIPRRFEYKELVDATNGFSDDRRLGHGASGQVYKGVLIYLGRMVAVKRISADFEDSEKFGLVRFRSKTRFSQVQLESSSRAMPPSPPPTTLIRSGSQCIPAEPRRIALPLPPSTGISTESGRAPSRRLCPKKRIFSPTLLHARRGT